MRFSVDRKALERELTFMAPVLPKWRLAPKEGQSAPPQTCSGLAIDCRDGEVQFRSRSGAFLLSTTVSATETIPGSDVINGVALPGLTQLLTDDTLHFKTSDNRIKLTWSTGHAFFPRSTLAPAHATLDQGTTNSIPADTLRAMLKKVQFAFPPVFEQRVPGVRFEFDTATRLVAVEGAVMAVSEHQVVSDGPDGHFILPAPCCDLLASLARDMKNEAVTLKRGQILSARCGGRTVWAPLAPDVFPPWRRLLTIGDGIRADFAREVAEEALRRTCDSELVDITLRKGELRFSDANGGASETVGMDYDGVDATFRVQSAFIKGALAASDSVRLELLAANETSHFLLQPLGSTHEAFVISPIRRPK